MSSVGINLFNNVSPLHNPPEVVAQEKGGAVIHHNASSSLPEGPRLMKNISKIDDLNEAEEMYAKGTLFDFVSRYLLLGGLGSAFSSHGFWGILVAALLKYTAALKLVPEDARSFRHTVAKWSPLLPVVGETHSFYTVCRNSISKLGQCLRNCRSEPKKALTNGAVHVVNMAGAAQSLVNHIGFVLKLPSIFSSIFTRLRPAHTAAEFAHLNTEQRLSCPELDPTNRRDAEIMMGIDSDCQAKGFCDNVCSAVRKTFRKLSLGVHPDKRGPEFTGVFQRLNTAKDTLNTDYKC